MATTVLAFSGGPASATLLWELRRRGHRVRCVHVDYGQASARREHAAAATIVGFAGAGRKAGAEIDLLGVRVVGFPARLVPSSPHSENRFEHYALTVLSVAGAHAADLGADRLACAASAARLETEGAWEHLAVVLSIVTRRTVGLYAALRECDPQWVVTQGVELGAPLEFTWSCLLAGADHCGHCRGCVARRRAFAAARQADFARYAPDVDLQVVPMGG